jgi:hypothetical protein
MAGTIALTEWGSAGPEERARLIGRPEGALKMFDPELSNSVGEIVLDVKENGDDAIVRALSRFDGCEVTPDRIRVSEDEFERARAGIDPDLAAAIRVGIDNVRRFSERAIADLDWREEIAEGLVVGEKATPIESAGLFVPSGKGSYPSVLIQIGAPAVTAKVANIAVVVPPVAGGGGGSIRGCCSSPPNSGYPMYSGSTARPESPPWLSVRKQCPKCCKWSAPEARRFRPPRSSANAMAA